MLRLSLDGIRKMPCPRQTHAYTHMHYITHTTMMDFFINKFARRCTDVDGRRRCCSIGHRTPHGAGRFKYRKQTKYLLAFCCDYNGCKCVHACIYIACVYTGSSQRAYDNANTHSHRTPHTLAAFLLYAHLEHLHATVLCVQNIAAAVATRQAAAN